MSLLFEILSDLFLLLLFLLRFYLFIRQRERQPVREGTQAGGVGEEEAGSQHRMPHVGLDPRTPGSRLDPKADA